MILSGNPFDYVIAFFGGILVSLTPCVYPLIPISAGYIAVRADGSKIKGLILSLIYVTGIAVTYSILGLLASLSGSLFGVISANPITHITVGLIIFLFGLSMLDWIKLPQLNLGRSVNLKREGFFPVFLLGLSSGLIVSPCVTPLLGAILAYIATKKHIIYGTTLLITFAYGMGFILVIAGTFSTVLLNIPKAGRWMVYVKKTCGLILILAALYFIYDGLRRI